MKKTAYVNHYYFFYLWMITPKKWNISYYAYFQAYNIHIKLPTHEDPLFFQVQILIQN